VDLGGGAYYLNYGYKPGSTDATELAEDVKSGRSFGASAGHKALDASDAYYLTELGNYLGKTKDPSSFYEALFNVLTESNGSDIEKLPADGQAVATDFVAIYTAELDRSLMSNLQQHPWENDLAEVTLLSAYGNAAGLVMKSGKLVKGTPKDYFAVGKAGSGIGETRADRQKLQRLVSQAEAKLNPGLVANLEKIIGKPADGDLIHGIMQYLNNLHDQSSVAQQSADLTKVAVQFLQQLHDDAAKITPIITKENQS